MSEITESIANAPIEYGVTNAALNALQEKYSAVPTVSDTKGLKAIQVGIGEIRDIRVKVEKRRKELKADSLAYGRKDDDESRRITSVLTGIEDPMKAEKERYEAEKARIKRETEEAEARRIAGLQSRVQEISDLRSKAAQALSSTDVRGLIEAAAGIVIDETYQEFKGSARAELDETRADLAAHLEAALSREEQARKAKEEAERLAEDRAKLEAERVEMERQRAETQAKMNAERAAIEEEKRRQAEIARQKEMEEQARIAAEKKLQEEKAQAEAEERRRQAELPDRERLTEWLTKIGQIQVAAPQMATPSGQQAIDNILSKLSEFTNYATGQARRLGE